jgi:hypothetical protein
VTIPLVTKTTPDDHPHRTRTDRPEWTNCHDTSDRWNMDRTPAALTKKHGLFRSSSGPRRAERETSRDRSPGDTATGQIEISSAPASHLTSHPERLLPTLHS